MSTARATDDHVGRSASVAPGRRRRVERPEDRPELRLVPRQAPRRRMVGVVVTLASVALFASLFGLAVFHTMLVQSQSTLDELDAQLVEAHDTTERLRLQVAELEAPDRIVSVATDDLGMIPPDDVVLLTPGSDG